MQPITQLKVAHLTTVHRASDTRIAHRECATLVDAGYDVVLIATGSGRGVPAGVRYRQLDTPRNRLDRMTRTMFTLYRHALAERADVYHFHDPELIPVGLLLRLRGARVVFDVHEDIPKDILDKPWIPSLLRKPTAVLTNAMLRIVQGGFSAIVAATPAIAQAYPHPRKTVVANYPALEELAAGESDFSQRERRVVYVGEITRLRGVVEMVNAVEALPRDIHLTLVGPFETPALAHEVNSLTAWKRVEYLGPRHRSDLPAILGRARAGLLIMLPARNHIDALPTKMFEYMAAGLPVIVSSAVPLCAEVVRRHECGLVVDPADCNAIAQAIRTIVDDPQEAARMGKRGFDAVQRNYQWASEGDKLTNLYAQIA